MHGFNVFYYWIQISFFFIKEINMITSWLRNYNIEIYSLSYISYCMLFHFCNYPGQVLQFLNYVSHLPPGFMIFSAFLTFQIVFNAHNFIIKDFLLNLAIFLARTSFHIFIQKIMTCPSSINNYNKAVNI